MGMAASQARLLSITSRIADNELRAQIVNNSKMRLATESSKVSEEYVRALNDATMMMSNYDIDGNSQTQKLTYNALTAYSAHNNQYGLVNANGKILVSEKEAEIFRKSNGELDNYLAEHGLEYSSTYFTRDTFGATSINVTGYNDTTNSEYNIGVYSIEELKAMYEGQTCSGVGTDHNHCTHTVAKGVHHLGYDASLQSFEYANYADYYAQFENADINYYLEVYNAVQADLFPTGGDFDKHVNAVKNAADGDYGTLQAALNFVGQRYTDLTSSNPAKLEANGEYAKALNALVTGYNSSTTPPTLTITQSMTKDANGNFGIRAREDGTYDITLEAPTSGSVYTIKNGPNYTTTEEKDDGSTFTVTYSINGSGTVDLSNTNANFSYTLSENDGSETKNRVFKLSNFDTTNNTVQMSYQAGDFNEARSYVLSVLNKYSEIGKHINRDSYVTPGSSADAAKKEYEKALDTLLDFIFGDNFTNAGTPSTSPYEGRDIVATDGTIISGNEYYLNDPGWIISHFGNKTSEQFQVIADIYILDQVFNVYGEPNWGWIDKSNPSENADAKVKWYTNLFERMKKGFTVIEDGLASSNEWIRFALESGIVSMEQVDTNNNWVSMLHSNCSDITEVTDEKAVAVAEAEYNKAMNNIENKDKRFDMELKNIDTEHNSLQTEYDSIKSVISKNIERSFKIYQA